MKKGFTLIELLAVIAILAIILLIAVPMVLNTIAKSKESALGASATMIWGAAEDCIAMNAVNTSMCTMPTPLTGTTKGFRNFTTGATWVALDSLSGFSGSYQVTMGTSGTSAITEVKVTNDSSITGFGTHYTCTLSGTKNATPTCQVD